jgi:shikimate dehydrogenase
VGRRVKKLYLLGHPVSHSLSPIMQNTAIRHFGLDWRYETLDVLPEDLIATLERLEADPDVIGCNVTVPHKVAVYEWLGRDRCLADARRAYAVNTLFKRDWLFIGDSTDFQGAMAALDHEGFPGVSSEGSLLERDVAILGTGGSAQTIALGLATSHACPRSVTIFGRNLDNATRLSSTIPVEPRGRLTVEPDMPLLKAGARHLSEFATWNRDRPSVIVQTTTVGMDSGEAPGQSPVPSGSIHSGQIAFDLVYKPHDTPFLLDAAANGATTVHGVNMLVGQGARSLERWILESGRGQITTQFVGSNAMSVMRSALGV